MYCIIYHRQSISIHITASCNCFISGCWFPILIMRKAAGLNPLRNTPHKLAFSLKVHVKPTSSVIKTGVFAKKSILQDISKRVTYFPSVVLRILHAANLDDEVTYLQIKRYPNCHVTLTDNQRELNHSSTFNTAYNE